MTIQEGIYQVTSSADPDWSITSNRLEAAVELAKIHTDAKVIYWTGTVEELIGTTDNAGNWHRA